MFDFYIKKGDRLPEIEAVLKYADGTVINLTGASVKFIFKKSGATTAVVGNAVIVDEAAGSVKYSWGATDTDTKGAMTAEWEVTIGTNKITVPNHKHINILVHEDLGDAP
jgi:hypothetical protein